MRSFALILILSIVAPTAVDANRHGGVRQRMRVALASAPPPLISRQHKTILAFSAKAGCTFAVKWMFRHIGLLAAAEAHHPWVHRYRTNVYYSSREYQLAREDVVAHPQQYRVVKVVRDPFARAVSSYVAANTTGHVDTELSDFLQREVSRRARFSFREFVDFLADIDLAAANIHHRLQSHPIDRVAQELDLGLRVVRLEESMQRLPEVEDILGLPRFDLQLIRESPHHTQHDPNVANRFYADTRFEIFGQRGVTMPPYTAFYRQELLDRIDDLYRVDVVGFGYKKPTLPR